MADSATAAAIPVALCITELDPGGAERALVRLAKGLDPAQWDVVVYCLGPRAAMAEELDSAGIRCICLEARHAWQFPAVLLQLRRELKRQQPAVVQSFLFHANVLGRIAARMAGVPVVVSGIRVAERQKRWHRWLDRWTDRLVDRHVCVSEEVRAFSQQVTGLPAAKLVVIPNGIDTAAAKATEPADLSEFGIDHDAPVVLTVGRLDRQKGCDALLPCAADWLTGHPDVHWVFAGEGPLRPLLERQIQDSGVSKRIHLVGWREDVPALLRRADIFVLASRWEGQPNVLLEAMAAGTAVLSTPVEGTAALLQGRPTGLLLPPVDSAGFCGGLQISLELLIGSPEKRQELGAAAQQHVIKEFTIELMVARFVALYRELLQHREQPGPKSFPIESC